MKLKSKRILIITGGTYVSGAEKVTLDVIQGLKEAGNKLFCITSGWTDGQFSKYLRKMEVRYKPLKLGWYYISNIKWSFDSLVNYPKSLFQFFRVLTHNKFDLVYTSSFRYIILLYPFLKNNIIYHVHDPNSYSSQNKFFLKLADKKVVKYIAVSEFIKKDLVKCGIRSNKVEVIHNGTDQTEARVTEIKDENAALTIGIVGQIIERKGHEEVITALKILKEKQLNVSLIIVGKGDEKFVEKLKSLIFANNLTSIIEWRNFRENLIDIYKGISVVVAPTRNEEPFGLIAIESNMLGIPVIVSKKGGLIEIVVDGYNGFLIETYNPIQLADAISMFYDNRNLVFTLGQNGRKRAIENFTKEKMILKVQQLINNL